jgi:hypothetical protein
MHRFCTSPRVSARGTSVPVALYYVERPTTGDEAFWLCAGSRMVVGAPESAGGGLNTTAPTRC